MTTAVASPSTIFVGRSSISASSVATTKESVVVALLYISHSYVKPYTCTHSAYMLGPTHNPSLLIARVYVVFRSLLVVAWHGGCVGCWRALPWAKGRPAVALTVGGAVLSGLDREHDLVVGEDRRNRVNASAQSLAQHLSFVRARARSELRHGTTPGIKKTHKKRLCFVSGCCWRRSEEIVWSLPLAHLGVRAKQSSVRHARFVVVLVLRSSGYGVNFGVVIVPARERERESTA